MFLNYNFNLCEKRKRHSTKMIISDDQHIKSNLFAGRRNADHKQQRAVFAQHEPEQYSRLETTVRILDIVAARHWDTAAGWLQHGKTTTPHLPEPERTTTTTTNTLSITPATGTAFPLTLRYSVRIFTKTQLGSRLPLSISLSLSVSNYLSFSV